MVVVAEVVSVVIEEVVVAAAALVEVVVEAVDLVEIEVDLQVAVVQEDVADEVVAVEPLKLLWLNLIVTKECLLLVVKKTLWSL